MIQNYAKPRKPTAHIGEKTWNLIFFSFSNYLRSTQRTMVNNVFEWVDPCIGSVRWTPHYHRCKRKMCSSVPQTGHSDWYGYAFFALSSVQASHIVLSMLGAILIRTGSNHVRISFAHVRGVLARHILPFCMNTDLVKVCMCVCVCVCACVCVCKTGKRARLEVLTCLALAYDDMCLVR